MEKGMEKGREEEKTSIVTNLLLKSKLSLQEIAEFANAFIDYVVGIKNKIAAEK